MFRLAESDGKGHHEAWRKTDLYPAYAMRVHEAHFHATWLISSLGVAVRQNGLWTTMSGSSHGRFKAYILL
jgi:hypothetical protein